MGVFWSKIRKKLDRFDSVLLYGAGRDIAKPKKRGKVIVDLLDWFDYVFFSLLDRIDTAIFFEGRAVRAARGRVRSRLERKLAYFFERNGVRYQYERPITLDGIKLHPDFYLPDYQVYVELWGMSGLNQRYTKIMERKKALYKKHKLPVISLYQWHLRKIDQKFPALFKKLTGKDFPRKEAYV